MPLLTDVDAEAEILKTADGVPLWSEADAESSLEAERRVSVKELVAETDDPLAVVEKTAPDHDAVDDALVELDQSLPDRLAESVLELTSLLRLLLTVRMSDSLCVVEAANDKADTLGEIDMEPLLKAMVDVDVPDGDVE